MRSFAASAGDGAALQQFEMLLRGALFSSGRQTFAQALQHAVDRADAAYQPKAGLQFKGRVKVQVQCIFGLCEIERDYYYCPADNKGHAPADAALGWEGFYTPALFRLLCLESADEPSFEQAEKHLKETGGIEVSARQLQRAVQHIGPAAQQWQASERAPEPCDAEIMYVSADGTGVPMRRAELAGRKGKQPDGTAKTRQAYLGCVFTQHRRDEKGSPIRDHDSTSYLSTFGPAEDLGILLRREARRRGSGTVKKIVLLLDGALGLENLGKLNFPGCQQIVDFYHAVQHLKTVLEALLGPEHADYKKTLSRWKRLLLKNGVKKIISQARQQSAGRSCEEKVSKALNYFEHNVERMQYATFRKLGYFIGSGVVEAGCKTVIGGRCKQSGMFWSEPGAGNVLALRCIKAGRQWDSFWKNRINEHSARNDVLSFSS